MNNENEKNEKRTINGWVIEPGADLTGAKLKGADLKGVDLIGVDLIVVARDGDL